MIQREGVPYTYLDVVVFNRNVVNDRLDDDKRAGHERPERGSRRDRRGSNREDASPDRQRNRDTDKKKDSRMERRQDRESERRRDDGEKRRRRERSSSSEDEESDNSPQPRRRDTSGNRTRDNRQRSVQSCQEVRSYLRYFVVPDTMDTVFSRLSLHLSFCSLTHYLC